MCLNYLVETVHQIKVYKRKEFKNQQKSICFNDANQTCTSVFIVIFPSLSLYFSLTLSSFTHSTFSLFIDESSPIIELTSPVEMDLLFLLVIKLKLLWSNLRIEFMYILNSRKTIWSVLLFGSRNLKIKIYFHLEVGCNSSINFFSFFLFYSLSFSHCVSVREVFKVEKRILRIKLKTKKLSR